MKDFVERIEELKIKIVAWDRLAKDNEDNKHNLSTSEYQDWIDEIEGFGDDTSNPRYFLNVDDYQVRCEMSRMAYQGEKEIDISTHPEYKDYTEKDWMVYFIEKFGGYDGAHHKDWVLDQCVRIAKGTSVIVKEARWSTGEVNERIETGEPSKEYLEWVEKVRGWDDEEEDYIYSYDEGVAP